MIDEYILLTEIRTALPEAIRQSRDPAMARSVAKRNRVVRVGIAEKIRRASRASADYLPLVGSGFTIHPPPRRWQPPALSNET